MPTAVKTLAVTAGMCMTDRQISTEWIRTQPQMLFCSKSAATARRGAVQEEDAPVTNMYCHAQVAVDSWNATASLKWF